MLWNNLVSRILEKNYLYIDLHLLGLCLRFHIVFVVFRRYVRGIQNMEKPSKYIFIHVLDGRN